MRANDDALLAKLKQSQENLTLAESLTIKNEFDGLIARLWRQGFDTVSIARYARIDEAKVANRLAQLRDEGAL
jgi:hypothetical protein